MTPVLECVDVTVRYADSVALSGFNLEMAPGETVAILGPSGSGKSTAMYSIAGFTPLAEGTISIEGREVSRGNRLVPPEDRPVGLVFQNYALWPHMTALDNVAYPLRRAGEPRSKALGEAGRLLAEVGISDLGNRMPAELSGGQQQRVGLARALARRAKLYLFDEPTAHLDAHVRAAIEEEIRKRRAELGAAALYTTHDSAEALAVADRIALLRHGGIVQVGSPTEIYERPADEWAARLTGPVAALRVETIRAGVGKIEVSIGDSSIVAETNTPEPAGSVVALVRPEWVKHEGPIRGTVEQSSYRGPHTEYTITTAVGQLVAQIEGPPRLAPGSSTGWTIERAWVPG